MSLNLSGSSFYYMHFAKKKPTAPKLNAEKNYEFKYNSHACTLENILV
jgi:hypothetical protein